jgi:hypothetical protein
MRASRKPRHQRVLTPILVVLGSIVVFAYGTVALISQDPLWFLTRVDLPDAKRIVIRVDGEETVLMPGSEGYAEILAATRSALTGFKNWAPGSMGLSPSTQEEYQTKGTILELYFAEPIDFHLPFNEGNPTALLMPVSGRFGGEGYVFRGRNGRWWAGQLTMSNPGPLYEAVSAVISQQD